MISALYLANPNGDIILRKHYRDNVTERSMRAFLKTVISAKEAGNRPPLVQMDNCSFLYTRHEDIYFVAVTKANINPGK